MKTRLMTSVLSTALFTAFLAATATPLALAQQADRQVQQPSEPQASMGGFMNIESLPGESTENASGGVESDEIDAPRARAATRSEFSRTLTANSGSSTTADVDGDGDLEIDADSELRIVRAHASNPSPSADDFTLDGGTLSGSIDGTADDTDLAAQCARAAAAESRSARDGAQARSGNSLTYELCDPVYRSAANQRPDSRR